MQRFAKPFSTQSHRDTENKHKIRISAVPSPTFGGPSNNGCPIQGPLGWGGVFRERLTTNDCSTPSPSPSLSPPTSEPAAPPADRSSSSPGSPHSSHAVGPRRMRRQSSAPFQSPRPKAQRHRELPGFARDKHIPSLRNPARGPSLPNAANHPQSPTSP